MSTKKIIPYFTLCFLLLFSCQLEDPIVLNPEQAIELYPSNARIADHASSIPDFLNQKIARYNYLSEKLELPSFHEKWGTVNWETPLSYKNTVGNVLQIYSLTKETTLSHFFIIDSSITPYKTYILSPDSQAPIIDSLRLPFTSSLLDMFNGFAYPLDNGEPDTPVQLTELPEGCYEIIICGCETGWGLSEVECSGGSGGSGGTNEGPSGGTSTPEDTGNADNTETTSDPHGGSTGGGTTSGGGLGGNNDGDYDAHANHIEQMAIIGDHIDTYGSSLMYSINNSPVLYSPICGEESFPYVDFPDGSSYYTELSFTQVWVLPSNFNLVGFCIPDLCIQVPAQNSIGISIPPILAAELTAKAFDAAKIALYSKVDNGNINFSAAAQVFFTNTLKENLSYEFDVSISSVSVESNPCNISGVNSTTPSYQLFGVGPCIDGVDNCD